MARISDCLNMAALSACILLLVFLYVAALMRPPFHTDPGRPDFSLCSLLQLALLYCIKRLHFAETRHVGCVGECTFCRSMMLYEKLCSIGFASKLYPEHAYR